VLKWGTAISLVKIISHNLETVWDKLVLITNRKSYMSFRLLPKSVTLNGVMAVALPYFTDFGKPTFQHITVSICGGIYVWVSIVGLFCSVCTMSSVMKFTFAISSPDEFLVLGCCKSVLNAVTAMTSSSSAATASTLPRQPLSRVSTEANFRTFSVLFSTINPRKSWSIPVSFTVC